MKSHILITSDFDAVKERLMAAYDPARLAIFEDEEFKIDMAKEVIREAYIASDEEKVIALFANKFNEAAQNRLLKILEEPPENVIFLLVAKSKSTFLPTILSRLPLQKEKKGQRESYRFERFDLATLYELVRSKEKISKSQARAILKGMLEYGLKEGFAFTQKELEYFSRAIHLIETNSNPQTVFATAGLILLQHQKRRRR